jgi:hypothetical protein
MRCWRLYARRSSRTGAVRDGPGGYGRLRDLFHDLTSSASVSRSREAGARSSRSFPDKRVIARLLTGGAFVYAHVSRGCKVVSGL